MRKLTGFLLLIVLLTLTSTYVSAGENNPANEQSLEKRVSRLELRIALLEQALGLNSVHLDPDRPKVFRNLAWGDPVSCLGEFEYIGTREGLMGSKEILRGYTKRDEDLKLDNSLTASLIEYWFLEGKLAVIGVFVSDYAIDQTPIRAECAANCDAETTELQIRNEIMLQAFDAAKSMLQQHWGWGMPKTDNFDVVVWEKVDEIAQLTRGEWEWRGKREREFSGHLIVLAKRNL